MIDWLLVFAALQVEPPKTVNGDTLGAAADFASAGPAIVCMRNMAVRANSGETVYLGYAGIHSGTLRLVSGSNYIDFTHGEILAKPKGSLQLTKRWGENRLYRQRQGSEISYVVFAAKEEDPGERLPQVIISGTALRGDDGDLALLGQLNLTKDEVVSGCDRTYTYGWAMLLGDEELSRKEVQ